MSFHPLPVHAQGESPRSKTEDADETKSVSSAIARAFAREKFQRRVMSFVAIVAYVMSGLTIVVVNKCVVRDSGLHAPALVSSMGALFTAMTTRFLVFIGKVEVREVDLTPLEFAIWRAFPVGVLAAGSLCFGNMSYIYLDAGFIQMLKAGTPALLLFVLSVCKIEKITPLSASLALTMVCGSALATLQQPNINTWGLIIQAASQACEVLQCTAVQNFLQKLGFNAFDAGYYLAPAVAMCCLLSSMAIEWPQIIRDQQVWLLCSQLPLLLASGSIGIVVNLSSLLVIKYTSSLLAKLLVIVRSSVLVLFFIVLGEEFTWLQVVGYMVTIMAFSGYSALKATEVDKKQQDEDLKRLSSMEEGALEEAPPAPSTFEKVFKTDLTSFFFWFALLIVVGSGYQAFVLGVIESREGIFGHPYGLGTMEVPPVPYVKTEKAPVLGAPVQSSLKVLYLDEGHFLLHVNKTARLLQRSKEDYLSSAWLVTSSQFGTVQLRAMEQDETRWLDCQLGLTMNIREACDFWMTPTSFDGWAKTMDGQRQEFILRRADRTEGNTSVAQNGTYLMWHSDATLFHVADWVPEACSLQPLPPAPERYTPAANEVTVTFFTKFDRYEKLLQFREVLTSVFMHLKESEFYVKEFLAIDEWYDGPSIALDGTKKGLMVEDSRAQSLAFFPGCVALNASEAADRPPSQRCSFLAKSEQQHGEAQSLNILLSLVTTKYWLHIDMDTVFHQDFYLSRLLQPIYEQKERCDDAIALASPPPPTTTKATTTPELSRTDEETWQEDTGSSEEAQEEDISYEDYDEDTDEEGLDEDESEAEEKPLYYKGEFFGPRDFRSIGATWSQRRLKDLPACRAVAGVRLDAGEMIQGRRSTTKPYRLERYRAPKALYNDTYVEELLNISAVLDKESPKWEAFQKAVRWPLFRLRSGLFDLTFVKSMEAPKMGSGVFSEDEDFRQSQLEFALRWARSGAKYAYLTHSLC